MSWRHVNFQKGTIFEHLLVGPTMPLVAPVEHLATNP